jgi:hypothetical protein
MPIFGFTGYLDYLLLYYFLKFILTKESIKTIKNKMKSTIVILSHLSFLLPVQVQMLMFQRLVLKEMGIDKNERQNLNSETSGAAMEWQEFYL